MMRTLVVMLMAAQPLAARAECLPEGDVVLNEFMPDPSGTDAEAEWVELYNAGSATVQLEGWHIDRALAPDSYTPHFTVPAGTELAPGAFVVLGGNLADLPDAATLFVDSGTAGMGNASGSSDAIRLVSCDESVRDVVVYGALNDPGVIFLDEEGEEVIDLKLAPKPSSGRSLARVPDGTDTNNGAQDFVVVSTPTPGATNGTTGGGTGGCSQPGNPGQVYINEFFANPGSATNPDGSGDSGYEWVELYNASDRELDLAGWQFEAVSTPEQWGSRIKFVLPPDTLLPPGEHLAIVEYAVSVPEGVRAIVVGDEGLLSLGNSADAVRLMDCRDREIDVVVYGGSNDDSFTNADGEPLEDAEVAPVFGTDTSLARRADGYNAGGDGRDLVLTDEPTLGSSNPDLRCKGVAGSLFINEFLANPRGSDSEVRADWVELYNAGDAPIDVSTWTLERATSFSASTGELNRTLMHSMLPGTMIDPGEFFVVGALFVTDADQVAAELDLPSGSGGDLVMLYDCEGTRADGVIYGDDNEDGLEEDDGFVAPGAPAKPGDDQCLARREDGLDDDNSAADFVLTSFCTLGESNARDVGVGGPSVPGPGTGCGGSREGQPRIAAPRQGEPTQPGCRTSPAPGTVLAGLLLLLGMRRRRD